MSEKPCERAVKEALRQLAQQGVRTEPQVGEDRRRPRV